MQAASKSLGDHFGWSGESDRVVQITTELLAKQHDEATRVASTEQLAAAVYFLLARRHLPLTAASVAGFTGDRLDKLWRVIRAVVAMRPELGERGGVSRFFTLHLTAVCKVIPQAAAIPTRDLSSTTESLVSIARADGLCDGRKEEPEALACLLVGIEAHLEERVGGDSILEISRALNISERTVTDRYRELRKALQKRAKELLPWPVTPGNIHEHVLALVKYSRAAVTNMSTPPPSFQRSQEERERRLKMIERVRGRSSGIVDGEATEEELVIEVLLEEGRSAEEILGLARLGIDLIY